jgi:hypothetical protein
MSIRGNHLISKNKNAGEHTNVSIKENQLEKWKKYVRREDQGELLRLQR